MSRPISAASRRACATRSSILTELVVKPVGEAGGYGITIGPTASRAELDECRAKLLADPANYISQPCIDLSVAPTLVDGRVEPRHVDLRPFAVTGRGTWVLPGGLTRVALREGLADRQLLAGRRVERHVGAWIVRSLARYAECIFWLARSVERAENLARILEVNETFSRDRSGGHELAVDRPAQCRRGGVFREARDAPAPSSVIALLSDRRRQPDLDRQRAVANARENARTLRPLISTEMWVQLNVFYNRAAGDRCRRAGARQSQPRLLTEIKEACQTFTGITEGTFYRDQAWYFYRLGRYIERADQTTRLLDTKYHLLTSGSGDRGPDRSRPVACGAALGLRLSRLPPRAFERSDAGAGRRLSAVQPALPALGLSLRPRGRRMR